MSLHSLQSQPERVGVAGPTANGTGLDIKAEWQGDFGSLILSGRFGSGCQAELEQSLSEVRAHGVRNLILDLRGVSALDGDGMKRMLAPWADEARPQLELILLRVPKRMQPLIQSAGLDRLLPVAYERPAVQDG